MQQVLFRIPLDHPWTFGPVSLPGFGFGVVLLLWALLGGAWFYFQRESLLKEKSRLALPAIVWLVVAGVIIGLPGFVQKDAIAAVDGANNVVEKSEVGSTSFEQAYASRDRAWRMLRRYDEAITTYEKEIKKWPDLVEPKYRLAWILATARDENVRDGKRAIQLAQQAFDQASQKSLISPDKTAALDVLAAAHAEAGQFDEAIKFAKAAAGSADRSNAGDVGEIGQLQAVRQRLERYDNERPYRDEQSGKSLPVYGYGFMMFLGFVAAGWMAILRGRHVGIKAEEIWDVCLWVLVGGIGGARLFYVVQKSDQVFEGAKTSSDYFFALINLQEGGLVLYGGIILALTAFIVFCLRRKLSPLLMTDVIMPSFFIGLAFGRLGCFMNGCCYGDRCELPWSVSFPMGSVPDMALVGRGYVNASDASTLMLHPTQIYSSLNALLLATVTHFFFRVRRRDGAVLAVALLTYPITRFLIEYLRSDEKHVLVLGWQSPFTISQLVSLGMLCFGAAYVLWLSRREPTLTPWRPLEAVRESDAAVS